MKTVGGSIQITYDAERYKYDLPIFIINDPISYMKEDDFLNKNFDKNKKIKVTLRYLNKQSESMVPLSYKILFLMVKARKLIKESSHEFNPENDQILLLHSGQILKEDTLLGNYVNNDVLI